MSSPFDYFVVFAEMRTGSNFLETNLNALDGVGCFGEAFNPHFIGYPNKTEILEISQAMRDADPQCLLDAIRDARGILGGFRYFHDHDPRILDTVLSDPRCAKIILTRNPLDSYVSWKIAKETGQWKLTNIKKRKEAQARFDAEEFARHVEELQDFQVFLLNSLQRGGQTPFYIAYEDLQDLGVLNGLAQWLGVPARLEGLDDSLKRQNPSPLTSKVVNADEMIQSLSGLDRFNLTRTPNFEPRRGPAVPTYVTGAVTPLMYLPVRGGPEDEVRRWMADLDGVVDAALGTGLNQKQVRQWLKGNEGHRCFTVVRHPLARAHAAFCYRILNKGPGCFTKVRNTLRRQFNLPIPEDTPGADYGRADHRAAFEAFLEFLRMNLAGQTAIRIDGSWCSQAQAIGSFSDFVNPDLILREDEMAEALPALARRFGHTEPPEPAMAPADTPVSLADIYDDALEALAADVYQRDYIVFGFGKWSDRTTVG
ncbi:nodulation protein NodH [Ruegeria sp. PrR005]|uniref:Nodulation protein NodH n=1 Tax=Ruegeria sp. PrR005 TaxID=2706882 RepID=A0A6B2NSR1_9RHOB|nr:nodulation protein NodH [Ruegeria sp. PrR005]NDW46448.1 nodulation protein NodH [Ruegeria sp. PrR005]